MKKLFIITLLAVLAPGIAAEPGKNFSKGKDSEAKAMREAEREMRKDERQAEKEARRADKEAEKAARKAEKEFDEADDDGRGREQAMEKRSTESNREQAVEKTKAKPSAVPM